MSSPKIYRAIGLMSGSSLDGLDIAHCHFWQEEHKWQFEIMHVDCIAYDSSLAIQLRNADKTSGKELALLDIQLAEFWATHIQTFIQLHNLTDSIDFIASHGHTVFHEPNQGYSTQIGNANTLAAKTNLKVVADFRMADIAAGGQGAPLVPFGEKHLFAEYDVCINLGGIANITFNDSNPIAYDVAVCNQVLNYLAQQVGKSYDRDGAIAAEGTVDEALLSTLNQVGFYNQQAPKSLSNQFVSKQILPILDASKLSTSSQLATYSVHIAQQLAKEIKNHPNDITSINILLTGGGAYNQFIVRELAKALNTNIVLPNRAIIEYKEAAIMAFLGLMRTLDQPNCLASVTGAKQDVMGGIICENVED